METLNPAYYNATPANTWAGRNDGIDPAVQRWHQRIISIDVCHQDIPNCKPGQRGIALIGFACDEGVRRNGGRLGAKAGPLQVRKACTNLPVHFEEELLFVDLGDIYCETATNEDTPEKAIPTTMEEAQQNLALLIEVTLRKGYQPLVIGGGHEVTYGHYCGINRFLPTDQSLGIINFDAHFDLREPVAHQTNSGTGFFQIAQDCQTAGKSFNYLPIGIQQNSNTQQLFERATALGVNYITAKEFYPAGVTEILAKITAFIATCDYIYMTIDLDVFAAAIAPGVSAIAYTGLFPDAIFSHCLDVILASRKVISIDIAELNPVYDIDQHTAKLAAGLAFQLTSKA